MNRQWVPRRSGAAYIRGRLISAGLIGAMLALGLTLVASDKSLAGEPEWWTAQKKQCGLPADLAYNDWNKVCNAPSDETPAIGGGVTSVQQMQLDLARQAGTALGQAIGNALFGNPQQDEANREAAAARAQAQAAAAAQAAAEQQRRAAELDRKAEEIKSQLLGDTSSSGSLSLLGVQSTPQLALMGEHDTADLQPLTTQGNGTQFFGSKSSKCPPSQDPSAVDLCGRGDTVDLATIKQDSHAASIGGAGLSTGAADATLRIPPSDTTGAVSALPSGSNAPADTKTVEAAPVSREVTLAKLVPLLRPKNSPGGGPIATANRPAICESLSRQLDEVQQLARRAVLELDVDDRYDLNARSVSPVMAAFDRVSDDSTKSQRDVMNLLLPGLNQQAIRNLLEPDNSGYRAAIYQDKAYPTKFFLVFRGSKTLDDWLKGNIPQAAGLGSAYFANAISLTKTLKQSTGAHGFSLELVGHSLGGGMADAAGAANQVTTTTFNPSGVHSSSLPPGTDMAAAQRYLTDVVIDNEPLNAHQDHPVRSLAQLYADSTLGGPLTPIALSAGAAADIANGGNVRQSLQEMTTLYSTSLPPAIGRRVTLEPDPADVDFRKPFQLHYMSSVVDAIVARSQVIYGQYTFNGCAQ